jgi:hypothetical protein
MRRLAVMLALAGIATLPASAQSIAAPDAATLAKYDKNQNGKLDPDEVAAMQADQAKAAVTPVKTSATATDQDVIALSPFEVDATRETGYYAENTLAGSRLKTNLGDLASSITVVTKQQLEDTGALSINDVFLYESNTEGAGNYTPIYVNRGTATDGIGGYSGDDGTTFGIATANRVRGLGSADTAQNNHPTIPRMAFDTYNTNSVEINRGPNSMLFGAGGASGVVNQSTAEAVLNKLHATVKAQVGSFGAHRESFGVNVPLGHKVAVYAAWLEDHKGYERKPSSDIYRRQYATLTFRPFPSTKITASYEHYLNHNNRPNFIDPSDYISNWLAAGQPGWDPTTQTITLANGTVKGPFLASTFDPRYAAALAAGVTLSTNGSGAFTSSTSAYYVPAMAAATHNMAWINNGQIVTAFPSAATAGAGTNGSAALPAATATGRTAAQWILTNTYVTNSAGPLTPVPPASTGATSYATWYDKGFTNQSLYDWTKYNSQGANYGTGNGRTFNVEWTQEIFPTLNFEVGWFRQEYDEWTHYGLGQANQATRLYVDTMKKLMNGAPNPFFGAPYIFEYQEDTFNQPEKNNNFRAMVVYDLNFAKNSGWTRFLGNHRFSALGTRQTDWKNNVRYRLSLDGGDTRFLPSQATAGFSWASSSNLERRYYLGGGGQGQITQGVKILGEPDFGGPHTIPLNFYDWNGSASWQTTTMNVDNNYFGGGATYKVIDAQNFAYQGNLWGGRIIPTLGARTDKVKIYTNNGRYADGTSIPSTTIFTNGFGDPYYTTVLQPIPYAVKGRTTTGGVVARPFSGWPWFEKATERGNLLTEFVSNLGFSYNQSDNFTPPTTTQTDFFENILPKPSGKGKDYGIRGTLLKNKLVWSLSWYKSTNENAVSTAASTAIGRAERIDTSSSFVWARQVVRVRNGQDPADINFDNNTVYPLTTAMQDQINALVAGPEKTPSGGQLVAAWQSGGLLPWPNTSIQGTNSQESKGMEGSLIFNPTRSWNLKLTVGQQISTYNKAIGEITAWLYGSGTAASGNGRLNFWQNLKAPDLPTVYTRSNGNKLYLGDFWNSYGYTGDANSNTTGATSTPQSNYYAIVDSQLYQLITLQGTKSPSQREWNSSLISSYNFQTGKLKGLALGGSLRWQSNAVVNYYGDLNPAKFTHPSATQNLISYPDLTKPIYIPALTNVDLWVSYSFRQDLFGKNIRAKVQLNIRDATEKGGLRPIVYEADGTPAQYRIVDPRTYFLTVTFDF